MSTTTLLFENIVIGAFAWSWVVALLIRFNTITTEQLAHLSLILQKYPVPLGVVFLLLVYPIGSMMNTICYAAARRIFAERQERKILQRFGLGDNFKDLVSGLKFVGQYGEEQLYADLQVFRPFMRISRAAVPHFLLLGLVLTLFGFEFTHLILLSFGIFILAIFACWFSYRFQNEEIAKACLVILDKDSKTRQAKRDDDVRQAANKRLQRTADAAR